MNIYLMVQRKKMSMLTDAKEDMTIREFKNQIKNIFKVMPSDQQLIYQGSVMDEMKIFKDYGITSVIAKPHKPANIGLAIKMKNGDFEELNIISYSKPGELPCMSVSDVGPEQ